MKIKWRREQLKLCENFYLSKQKTVLSEKRAKQEWRFRSKEGKVGMLVRDNEQFQ